MLPHVAHNWFIITPMHKGFIRFFDRLEDKVRIGLSRAPILYALIGAVGIVLVWKGVWESAEYFPFLFGPASFLLGIFILLASGLLVSFFIGDSIILSGFKQDKKLAEKTEAELRAEQMETLELEAKIDHIEHDLHELKKNHRTGHSL